MLTSFVDELRAVGIPVSMVETLDAAEALVHTDLTDRENLRASLGATLIKNPHHYGAFDAAFDVYFGHGSVRIEASDVWDEVPDEAGDRLRDAVIEALLADDRDALRALVGRAVDEYAGIQPGRPVGGRYYTYRV
ncbi:hypothetical protein ACFLQ7_00445, partial [Actinomycetota bacterium]